MIEAILKDAIKEVLREELKAVMQGLNFDRRELSGEKLLNIPKVAERLDCSRTQVYNFHIEKMGLKTCNENGRMKVRESDLNNYILNLK